MTVTETAPARREALRGRLGRRFTVRPAAPEDTEALWSFFHEAYADQPVAGAFRDQALIAARWRWLNETHPASSGGRLPAWVCLRQDRIVGHFAALPATATIHGAGVPVVWGRDLIVSESARQQGAGPLLIATAVAESAQPFLIAGLNAAVHPLYRRLGFLDRGTIPLYVKVLQPARFVRAMPWPALVRPAAAAGLALARRATGWRPRRGRLSLRPIQAFGAWFDAWWAPLAGSFACAIRRDQATMAWRYHRHPTHRYQVWGAWDTRGLRGLVVIRHGRSRGLPAGFVTELLAAPDDAETQETLLRHAEEQLAATAPEPMAFLRYAVLHESFERAARRAGFLRGPSPLHWMMAHAQGEAALAALAERRWWFLNAGDSDLDFL